MPQAALAVAAWVGSVAFSVGSTAGLSVAAAATVANVAAGVALVGEVYGLAKATQALQPKIKDPGTATQWQADPRAGIPYAFGRCAVAGRINFNQAAGSSNKFLNFSTIYSGAGPIDGFEGFYGNDSLITFGADSGEGASGYYLNRMWQKRQLGALYEPYMHWTATGSKDTPANHGGMPVEWTSAHRLSGYAASLWALEYDTSRFASGVPEPKMVGRWVKVYDPRKDSTYPGGSGAHRYAEPSNKVAYEAARATWEWTDNPYLHGLMWCLGRWISADGVPLVRTHGLGAPIDMIDVASFVDGANVAEANDWTCGGVTDTAENKWEVLKAFLQAGAGKPVMMGAKIGCIVNTPRVSLTTITKADVIGDVSVAGAVDIDDRINTIWPSYTEEAQNWAVVTPDAPVQVAAYIGPDKGERSIPVTYQYVQKATQTGQLARYDIEDSRELTPIVLTAKPWTMWLKPGDCFTATEPEWGLNGQKLLILKRTRDPATMTVGFICRTETDGKHPFALGQTLTPPDTPALTGVDPNVVPLPGAGDWVIVGGVTANEFGSLPAIVIQGESALYDAVSIVVDYREVIGGGTSYGPWLTQTFPASARQLVVTGVKPGAVYQVRVRYITAKGVENPDVNLDLGHVTTGDFIAREVLAIGGVPPSQVVQGLRDLSATGAAQAAAVIKLALDSAAAQAVIEGKTYTTDGKPVGPVTYEQKLITDTLVKFVTLLGIFNGPQSAVILNAMTVEVSPGVSLASWLTYVSSTLGDGTVTVSMLLEAINGQAGRIALAVQNATEIVGLDLGVDGTSSHFDMVSSKFRFIDPAGVGPPTTVAAYGGGKWVFDAAMYVRSLIADTIETQHLKVGSVVWDKIGVGQVITDRIAANNVTVPAIASASNTVNGTGSFQSILSTTVYLPEPGTVKAACCVAQHFPTGNHPWEMRLMIDGVLVFPAFGSNFLDSVPLSGAKYCSAGTISVEILWNGHTSTNIDYRNIDALGVMR